MVILKIIEVSCFIEYFSSEAQGFTLPVWVVAAAKAAIQVFLREPFVPDQIVFVPNHAKALTVPVKSPPTDAST